MRDVHKILRYAAACCCVLTMFAAQAARVNIAAVVGDDIISTTDVSERRDLIMATAGIPETVENQQKIAPRIMQSLIDETLQMQEAKRQSVAVTEEELSKAIDDMGARDNGETVREFIKRRGLSLRSMENQLRAQLAWNKVVQRKLRRNVSISQDEIARARQAEASAPGEAELRLQALEIRIPSEDKADAATKLAEEVALDLKAGAEMGSVAARLIGNPNVRYSQPTWVPEKNLPPPLQQALRAMKAGEYTPPLRGGNAIQILQVMDRKTAPKLADTTEFAIKQISIAVPKKRDKPSLAKLSAVAETLRADSGSCMDDLVPKVDLPAQAKFVRLQLANMSPEQRSVVSHLEVGDVSEPLMSPDALRFIVMCEKIEPSGGALPDAEKIRQQLFAEKIELEAEKHLRNLRREAYIDIKGDAK
jgi:peptidyl-prolyl cis-trans isomerase SurA